MWRAHGRCRRWGPTQQPVPTQTLRPPPPSLRAPNLGRSTDRFYLLRGQRMLLSTASEAADAFPFHRVASTTWRTRWWRPSGSSRRRLASRRRASWRPRTSGSSMTARPACGRTSPAAGSGTRARRRSGARFSRTPPQALIMRCSCCFCCRTQQTSAGFSVVSAQQTHATVLLRPSSGDPAWPCRNLYGCIPEGCG